MTEPAAGSSRFRVWVRRQDAAEAPYALRFEVLGGKGILRVARPGVLIDPPARPVGAEERLTGGQLRQSRFLHVREGGRERVAYALNRLDDGALDRLPAGEWVELVPGGEGHGRWLGVPAHLAEDVGDDPTNPQHAMLRDLSRDLRNLVERSRPSIPPPDDEILEADPLTSEEPFPAHDEEHFVAADPVEDEDTGEVHTSPPGAAGPPAGRATVVWSQAPVHFDAGAFDVEAFEEDVESTRTLPPAAPVAVPADEDDDEEPDDDAFADLHPRARAAAAEAATAARHAAPFDRATTLVRHFRRKLAEERARVEELEARVAVLEARLRSARGR